MNFVEAQMTQALQVLANQDLCSVILKQGEYIRAEGSLRVDYCNEYVIAGVRFYLSQVESATVSMESTNVIRIFESAVHSAGALLFTLQ